MKVYSVKLTKIESTHTKLRTNEVEGFTIELPEVGKSFGMVSESLSDKMEGRLVTTSLIQELDKKDSVYTFKTKNSIYRLDVSGTQEID